MLEYIGIIIITRITYESGRRQAVDRVVLLVLLNDKFTKVIQKH